MERLGHPTTAAYANFLLRTAWHERVAEAIAAMVPCLRLYAFLGGELSLSQTPENPFQNWIDTYSSVGFNKLCSRLESILNVVAEDCCAVRQAYHYAMQCELNFFSASLEILQ